MWETCSQLARRAIYLAHMEAFDLGSKEIDTEHLLLSLLRSPDSVARALLEQHLAIQMRDIHREIGREIKRGEKVAGQELRFSNRLTRVSDLSREEADGLGSRYMGTEHLLLGLAREEQGLAGHVLRKVGADIEHLRPALQAMHEGKESLLQRVKGQFLQAVERETGLPFGELLWLATTQKPEQLADGIVSFLTLAPEDRQALQAMRSPRERLERLNSILEAPLTLCLRRQPEQEPGGST